MIVDWVNMKQEQPPEGKKVWLLYPNGLEVVGTMQIVDGGPVYVARLVTSDERLYHTNKSPIYWALFIKEQ